MPNSYAICGAITDSFVQLFRIPTPPTYSLLATNGVKKLEGILVGKFKLSRLITFFIDASRSFRLFDTVIEAPSDFELWLSNCYLLKNSPPLPRTYTLCQPVQY